MEGLTKLKKMYCAAAVDFFFALRDLRETHVGPGTPSGDNSRLLMGAELLVLSRTFLFLGPWGNDLRKLGWRGVGDNLLPGRALVH